MAATAPFCNVTVFAPPAGPRSPDGFRFLNANATLAEVIAVLNNNFSAQVQQAEFNRQLDHDINGAAKHPVKQPVKPPAKQAAVRPAAKGATSPQKQPSKQQIPKAMDDKIGKIRFTQMSIVRQKIKVENPKDREQWIIDDRVKTLVMRDKTGALWTWQDKKAGKGVQAGTEETTQGEGHVTE